MAKLKVRWSETAVAEFGRMLTFYRVRNGNDKYGRSIVRMVNESLKLIAKFPRMYRLVNADEYQNIRMFHCDYFAIYYKVQEKDNEIIVEVVSDSRRNPDESPYGSPNASTMSRT